jgi:hypothetical protein
MSISKKDMKVLNSELTGDEIPAAFMLIENYGYSLDRALERASEVVLRNATRLECAKEGLDEIMSSYIENIPRQLQSYVNLDYEGFADDCRMEGTLPEFDFDGKTWTCLNIREFH